MLVVVAKNVVKQGRVEEFLKAAEELIGETRREEGCLEYVLMRDSEMENILTFIEKWASMAHLKAHFESPHFERIVPLLEELTEGQSEVNIYEGI